MPLAFRCERGPDQGMLNLRPPRVGLSRRRFYDTRLLRPFSIFRGATYFHLSLSSYAVGQLDGGEDPTLLLPLALARFSVKHDAKQ